MKILPLGPRVATTVLLVSYVAVPSSHHPLLPGIPFSIAGTIAMLLIVVHHARSAGDLRRVVVVALLLGAKAVSAITLPASGFQATYFGNPRFEGESYRTVDRVIDFDGRTFRREFLIDFRLQTADIDALPFSVRWRGWVASDTSTLTTEIAASAPAVVLVDGQPPPTTLSAGTHELVVSFVRATPAPPRLRASFTDGHVPLSVFTAPVSLTGVRLIRGYALVALVLDFVLLTMLAWALGAALRSGLVDWREGRRPSFVLVAGLVVTFWLVVGALRTGPYFSVMESNSWGDDWTFYEATARRILAGHLAGPPTPLAHATLLYPHALALLHVFFGPRHWPVYFAQHLLLGFACVAFGQLARELWGTRQAVLVMTTATMLGVLDVTRWYSLRFLGENVILLLLPLVLIAACRHVMTPTAIRATVVGASLAVLALTRFNMLPFAVLAVIWIAFRPSVPAGARMRLALTLVAAFCGAFALMPLREWVVSGHWALVPGPTRDQYKDTFIAYWRVSWLAPFRSVVVPNLAFMFGYPKFLETAYSVRPHWMLLWAGYATWAWSERRSATAPVHGLLHLYVAGYVAVMSVTPQLPIYGHRHMLALVFVLGLVFPQGMRALTSAVKRHG